MSPIQRQVFLSAAKKTVSEQVVSRAVPSWFTLKSAGGQ